MAEALEETREVYCHERTAPALFEAAFVHRGVLVRADVIERLPGGGWGLVEVKSTTRLKDVFVLDVAVQLWVLRGAGLDVRAAGVLTLDRDYVYDGKRLDLDALFKLHPVLDQAESLLDSVVTGVREMQAMVEKSSAPDIGPGDHCFTPYSCPYYAHCTRDVAKPEHGLDELPWLGTKRGDSLIAESIEEIRDIPSDFPLTPLQQIVRQAVREGRAVVRGNLGKELAKAAPPIRFLDFETFAPAIPRFAGTRPYDAIPFLFSVHTELDGFPPAHDDIPVSVKTINIIAREGSIEKNGNRVFLKQVSCQIALYFVGLHRARSTPTIQGTDELGAVEELQIPIELVRDVLAQYRFALLFRCGKGFLEHRLRSESHLFSFRSFGLVSHEKYMPMWVGAFHSWQRRRHMREQFGALTFPLRYCEGATLRKTSDDLP